MISQYSTFNQNSRSRLREARHTEWIEYSKRSASNLVYPVALCESQQIKGRTPVDGRHPRASCQVKNGTLKALTESIRNRTRRRNQISEMYLLLLPNAGRNSYKYSLEVFEVVPIIILFACSDQASLLRKSTATE
jgi:hypothetical protein